MNPSTNDIERDLIAAARAVRQQAYAPYSSYPVGAALLAGKDKMFTGANVENASYGLTICAERAAVAAAVSAGERAFQLLVVATSNGAPPCGACLQCLAEFCDDLTILLVGETTGEPQRRRLSELLPYGFRSVRLSDAPGTRT